MLANTNRAEFPVLRGPNNLSMRIDVVGIAAGVSGEHAEINHVAVFPQNTVMVLRCGAGEVGFTNNVATIIDPVGCSAISSQCA
jgi:hypothetical protein